MVKNLPASAEDVSSIPELRRSSGEGNGNPLQYSCLGIPWTMEPRGLQSTGSQKSQTWLSNRREHNVVGWLLLVKLGPLISSVNLHWELVRNAGPQAAPDLLTQSVTPWFVLTVELEGLFSVLFQLSHLILIVSLWYTYSYSPLSEASLEKENQ